jgi:predicted phage terminase large subunit-like protein
MREHWTDMEWFEEPVIGADGHTQFPTFYSDEEIARIKKNSTSFFWMSQMMNQPVDPASKVFDITKIQKYIKAPNAQSSFTTVIIDPAQGKETSKSKTAITVCATSNEGRTYVLDYKNDFIGPIETIRYTIAFAKRYNVNTIGFESVGYQAALEPYMRDEMRKSDFRIAIEAIKRNRASKQARILSIQPLIVNGDFYIREWMMDVVRQLDEFPHGTMDLLDTIADHVSLTMKFAGKLQFQLRSADVMEKTVLTADIPEEGENVAAVYMEAGDNGPVGYMFEVRIVDEVMYFTKVTGLGYDGTKMSDTVSRLPNVSKLITTPEIADVFFRDVPMSVVRRKLKTSFAEQAALNRIASGEVVLTEEAGCLTMSTSEVGLRAIEFVAANAKSGSMKAMIV